MVANIKKMLPLRPFSCIFFGGLKKKKYLCGIQAGDHGVGSPVITGSVLLIPLAEETMTDDSMTADS